MVLIDAAYDICLAKRLATPLRVNKSATCLIALCASILLSMASSPTIARGHDNWPQFRGPGGSGMGSGNPPTQWDVESGEQIRWRTEIDGLGHSCPVVWGDRVFVTTATSLQMDDPKLGTGWLAGTGAAADDEGDWSWQLLCFNLADGEIVWQKLVTRGTPAIKRHIKASHANCTPATDGRHLVAFFGSEGLYCFNLAGELLWEKNFGRLHSGPYDSDKLEWGFASSPVIFDGRVIVQCDCLNTSFVAVLDLETGKELLRIQREEVATWSTPTIVDDGNRRQIVCNGFKQMAGYDLETGERLWTLSGGGDVPVPTPLFANDLIYLTNGHKRSPTYAISPSATGDLTPHQNVEELPPGLVWWQPRDGSYMPTPIVVGERLYTCNDNGRLTVRHALTGDLIYKHRVGQGTSTYSASAVSAGGHLYFTDEAGTVSVVKTGDTYELLATNEMNETVMATPAISGNRLLIRTVKRLYCIESAQ